MQARKQWSTGKVLIVTVILSIAIGSLAGLGLGYTAQYQAPTTRVFYLFNSSVNLNESVFNVPPDIFSPDHLTVNRGDKIVIHYYNIEETGGDPHTFTMGAPYTINDRIEPRTNVTITFTADLPGVFEYVCLIHPPTMRGYLTVLG
jgi:plastocyanin